MEIEKIRDVAREIAPMYPVKSIDIFGSCATGDSTSESDIDLLVFFDEKVATLFDLSGLKFDIQNKLNKNIDIIAGPLQADSFLTINKRVRIYEA